MLRTATRPAATIATHACSACRREEQQQLFHSIASSSRTPPLRLVASSSSSSPPPRRSYSSVVSYTPTPDPQLRLAEVPNRSIISISGRDTIKLLQGLVSNNVTSLASSHSEAGGGKLQYCAFLNPQGRMISSAFLFPVRQEGTQGEGGESVLVDVDAGVGASLLAFIKKFKLRSKVTLRDISEEYGVWAAWGGDVSSLSLSPSESGVIALGQDVRSPLMGLRFLTRRDAEQKNSVISALGGGLDPASINISPPESYTIHRMLQGVPDGVEEIWENQSLPLEANVDFMHGVDFRKGCYVGQELTARTHHTGVVRKRIIPVSFYHAAESTPPPDTLQIDTSFIIPSSTLERGADVRSVPLDDPSGRGKSAGKYLSGVHNIGLALLRLEQVHRWNADFLMKVKMGDESEVCIRPWIPTWWPEEAQKPIQ